MTLAARDTGRLRLVQATQHDAPDPVARAIIDVLSHNSPAPGSDLAAIRRQHALSRRPFLAPLEPVHSTIRILVPGQPQLTVIRPHDFQPERRYPAIVFLHGGGWSLGSFETYEPFCRQLANAAGAVLVWVEYRLAPEHPFPAAFDDAQAALHWVFENADRINADPGRIILAGDSAGGNLAAATCLAEHYARSAYQPWRQVLLYPCLDLTRSYPSHKGFADGYLFTAKTYDWYLRNYLGARGDVTDWRLSPLRAPNLQGLPPTILLYAGFDMLRDEAAAFAMKLTVSDVPLETIYFPDMIHGFLTMGGALRAAGSAAVRVGQLLESFPGVGGMTPPA